MSDRSVSWRAASRDRLVSGIILIVVLGTLVSVDIPIPEAQLRLYLADIVAPFALALALTRVGWSAVEETFGSLETRLLGFAIITTIISLPLVVPEDWIDLWALSRIGAVVGCAGYVALGAAVIFAVGVGEVQRVLRALLLANAAMAATFLASRLIWPEQTGLFSDADRYVGLMANPNAMAIVGLLCAAIVLAAPERGSSRQQLTNVVLGGFAFFSIFATGSAAAVISVVALLALILLSSAAGVSRIVLSLALAAGLGTLMVASIPAERFGPSEQMMAKILPSIEENSEKTEPYVFENSVTERLRRYRQAFDLWLEHPVLGAGLGSVLRAQVDADPPSEHPTVVHNTYLWILAETGIVGFLAWLAFALAAARRLWPIGILEDDQRGLAVAMAAFVASWAFMMLFHEMLLQRLPWLAIGIGLALAWRRERKPAMSEVRP